MPRDYQSYRRMGTYGRRGRRWRPEDGNIGPTIGVSPTPFVPQAEAAQTMSVGNPAHGTINLGGFLRPRGVARPANADVLDPSYTPYKPAGFLRRLLGDRSNQLNEQYQQNLQRLLMEREVGRQDLTEEMRLKAEMANAMEQQRINNELKLMQQRSGIDAAEFERRARQSDFEKYGTEDPIALNALKEQDRATARELMQSQVEYNRARAFDALTPTMPAPRPPLVLKPGDLVQNPDGTYSKMPSEPSDIEQLGNILGGGSGAQGSRSIGPVRGFVPPNLRKPLTPGASNGSETWLDGTPTAPPNISEAVTEPGANQRPTSAMADYSRSNNDAMGKPIHRSIGGTNQFKRRFSGDLPRSMPSGWTQSVPIPTTPPREEGMLFIDTEEDLKKRIRKPGATVKTY